MNLEFFYLDEDTIQVINCSKQECLVTTSSTKEIDYRLLKKVKNKKTIFIIKSALTDEKYSDEKYKERTKFTLKQAKKLIYALNQFDKKIPQNLSDLEKALFVYNKLMKRLVYEDKHCFNKNNIDIRRTLYSFITKKAVCSGFSLILYEILNRHNIKNYYLHSNNHLFNVIYLDGKFYPVDLTWETVLKKKNKDMLYHYFGNYPLFDDTHHLVENETKIEYDFIENQVLYQKPIKLKTYKLKRQDNSCFYIAQLNIGENQKYYVILDKKNNLFDIISSKEDFDRIWNGNDLYLKECYVNSLLDGVRVKTKISNANSYVGYGYINDNIFFKHNKCDNVFAIKYKVLNNNIQFQYKNVLYNIKFNKNKFYIVAEKLC